MAGKFEVYEDKAGNGEIVASGEAYDTQAGARAGCQSVMNAAAEATIVDLTEN